MSARHPRIECGTAAWVVAPGLSWTGRAVNLSVGGAFIADCPDGVHALEAGCRMSVSIDLGDGQPAIGAQARLVWARRFDEPGRPAGVGVRFLRIEEHDLRRIAQLVVGQGERERGNVRLRLPGLPARVRATARSLTPGTMVLEADLSWLKLGTTLSTEIAPGDVRDGKLAWVAVEVTPAGHARLCLHVELVNRTVELVAEPEEPVATLEALDAAEPLDGEPVEEPTLVMSAFPG